MSQFPSRFPKSPKCKKQSQAYIGLDKVEEKSLESKGEKRTCIEFEM
jgi:hypothetical protein